MQFQAGMPTMQSKNLGLHDTYRVSAKKKDKGITAEKAIDGWAGHSQEKRLTMFFSTKKNSFYK